MASTACISADWDMYKFLDLTTLIFLPVVLEVTFRIVLILMIKYGWIGEIVNVETAFLYDELEEEIYLKIPTGLDVRKDI